MKKFTLFFLLLVICFTLSGCLQNEKSMSTTCTSTNDINTVPSTSTSKSQEGNKYNDLKIDIPQLGLSNQTLYYMSRGYLREKQGETWHLKTISVYIFADIEEVYTGDFNMIVKLGEEVLIYNLGHFVGATPLGTLDLADLDGDGNDEIILCMEVNGNGGMITNVFTIVNESIELKDDLSNYETGYKSEYKDNKILYITNVFVEFSYSLDISDMYLPDNFDENGKAIMPDSIFTNPIYLCTVEDIDNDNIYELKCRQQAFLDAYIGDVETILKYDMNSQKYEVVGARFIKKAA